MNIFILKTIKIRTYEMGLYFCDREFKGLLGEGRHWLIDPLGKVKVEADRVAVRVVGVGLHYVGGVGG